MAAMLCWKEAGCEAIVRTATSNPTSKNVSSAYKLLAMVAAGGSIDPRLHFIQSDDLTASINAVIGDGRLRQPAREYLMELLQALNTDDLLIPLGVAFSSMGLISEQGASELIRAISSRWLRVGPSVVKAYKEIIQGNADDEPAFQQFFCEHPQLLDPMALQVWSQPDFHGALEPDFVVRRADNSYLIVEIETPAKLLMTQAGQLSSEATHAEKQATDYRAFLDERIAEARQHFPYYQGAECLVVIGLETMLGSHQTKALGNANAGRHKVRIAGFDWLEKRAAAIIQNISAGEINVVKGYRVV
jgi:hypothetical protein